MTRQSCRIVVGILVFVIFLTSPAFAAGPHPHSRFAPVLQKHSAVESFVRTPNEPSAVDGLQIAAHTDDGRLQIMVELADPPAAVIYADAMKGAAKDDFAALSRAASATGVQIARLKTAQNAVAAYLPQVHARELYRVTKAMNGIAVAVEPDHLSDLRKIPGVKRLVPIVMEYPTNSTSVPFIGAPNVWANTIGLPAGADGTGVKIGIIDTGLDYMHADFGGTGILADYQAEQTDTSNFTTAGTATAGAFPTVKVAGGVDFAGDAYNGSNSPSPDANPMDCNGHGSHVAGTAGGYGVTGANTTFTGPYDANPSTYSALKIGPGSAPKATLYGIRVFGCGGGTGLTNQGIDWAMDPNGDNDLSDHLDVINMSLGSDYGAALSSSAIAADNAALAGVIVVMSAGNSGDNYFIAGSPGVATRGIATAASVDDGVSVATLKVNSPASAALGYIVGTAVYGPAASGQTADAVIADDGAAPNADACTALVNAAAIAGHICVVDRGTCSFKTKTAACQAAGAIGTLVLDNAFGYPPAGMSDDVAIVTPITIPTQKVTLADGNLIRNAINTSGPVNMTMLQGPGGDSLSYFSSRGPRRAFYGPLQLKPDLAAPGLNITSVQTGHTCTSAGAGCTGASDPSGFLGNSPALVISGTSMASPHVAGLMALLRQLHPDWSVEDLKALAMNYSIHDVTQFLAGTTPRLGPPRVGSGRVDAAASAVGNVIAFNADDAGMVSVSFNPEVVGTVTQVKKVRIANKGVTSQTYDLGIDVVEDAPGVSFSLPGGSSVTIPPGDSVDIDVQMTADSSQMNHVRDAATAAFQGVQANFGDQPRNFLTEKSGYLTFSQSSTLKMRLPLYMAEKAASNMSAADTIFTGGAPTGSTTIPLSGTGLCTGTLSAGPTCIGSFPTTLESLVSPFELHVNSPVNPDVPNYADIHYVGAAYFQAGGSPSLTNDLIMFGAASYGDWSTPNEVAYNICVDNNSDGVYDRVVINSVPSIFVANTPMNDTFVRVVQNTSTAGFSILGLASPVNIVPPNTIDTGLHLNNVMVLAASPSVLGYTSTAVTTMRYKVVTCPGTNPSCARTTTGDRCSPAAGTFYDSFTGPINYNFGAQGLNFGGDFLDEDLNGGVLPVTWNTANMTANGALGALLLHHQNASGKRAEVVLLDTAARVDLAVSASANPPNPDLNTNSVITVNVSNSSATSASTVEIFAPLPDGVTYVTSSASSGSYNPATGIWSIPTVTNASPETLQITVTAASTDPQVMTSMVSQTTPLDANPANDQTTITLLAPRSSDLQLGMTASTPTANPGQAISYTISLKNNGIDPAYSVNIADSFPSFPALAPTSSTASQGYYDSATKTWNLASLGNGGTATLILGLNAPNMAGNLQNGAAADSNNADPDTINNNANATIQVLSPANVTGTKLVSGNKYIGSTITYTVTLSNSSAFDQQNNSGNEFVDVLPSTLTLVSANATTGTAVATIGTNTVTWDGVVTAGGTVTITITATINNTATPGATITNTGTINYDGNGDGTNEATNNATANFVVSSPAAVTATKTVSGSFQPSGAITYTVTLSNSGPAAQIDNGGNEFTDVLPASLTLVSANATSGTAVSTIATNTVAWNGSIPAAGSVTITINATVNSNVTPLSTVSNQGTVSYDADGNLTNEASGVTDDPGTGAANDATSFVVGSPANLTAAMSVAGSGQPGSNVTYTVTITNNGAGTQLDNPTDEFTDTLPSSLTLVSSNATSGATSLVAQGGGVSIQSGETVHWNGSIPGGGGSVTITIVAQVDPGATPGTTISNQGAAHFDADGNGTNESTAVTNDPSTGAANDATSFMVASPATIVSPTKTVDRTIARRGDAIVYTIVITNSGAATQTDNPGDEMTDVLPASLDLISATASSGTAVADTLTRTVHWNGSLLPSASVTITINARVNANAAGTVTNQATVFYDADGNGTNESSVLTNDPNTPAAGDATALAVLASDIPTLSGSALMLLSLVLAGVAFVVIRRTM